MAKYSCKICQKIFSQKGHLEDHNRRKRPCKKDNTIEALVEKKVQEILTKTNVEAVKIDPVPVIITQSNQMDYSTKTREELITLCKERKIKGYSGKKKEDILKLLSISTPVSLPNTNNGQSSKFKFIDLFCGIGGFHQAMISLGGECVLACDIDKFCREVYKKNYGITPFPDVTQLKTETMPDFDVLCGGFPCQAFSHSGKQLGFNDTRGTLFRDVARILKDKQPKYFLLENVKNLKGHDGGKTWNVIYNALTEVGYVTYDMPIVVSPHMLGIPQHRERVMILGIRKDIAPAELPKLPTLKPQADLNISSILETNDVDSKYSLNESDKDVLDKWEEFVQHFKSKNVKLPTFPLWTDYWDSTASYKTDPEWKQKFIKQNQEFYKTNKNFLEHWLLSARKLEGFSGAKRKFEWQCGAFKPNDSIFTSLFQFRPSGIRVKRANYSPALVAMAQIVYVGEKKRKLTPREVARLQSFPDTFQIPSSNSVAYKQFGNAVNVDVIKWAAKMLFSMRAT